MNIPRFLRHAMVSRRTVSKLPRCCRTSVSLLAGGALLLPFDAAVTAQTVDPRTTQQETVNTSDPSEVFLKAYSSVQQAERLEQEGKSAPALAKYRFAASLLEQLTQTNPNWQPLIVRYRLRNTSDTIRRLQQKGVLQAATPAPGVQPQQDRETTGTICPFRTTSILSGVRSTRRLLPPWQRTHRRSTRPSLISGPNLPRRKRN